MSSPRPGGRRGTGPPHTSGGSSSSQAACSGAGSSSTAPTGGCFSPSMSMSFGASAGSSPPSSPGSPPGVLGPLGSPHAASSPPPLYDPAADDADAEWARRALGPHATRLSCPGCFALLCTRAQPHVEFEGQFRAVYVRGVRVDEDRALATRMRVSGFQEDEEQFQPVCCVRCQTEVAVLDGEGVYHFCNVLH